MNEDRMDMLQGPLRLALKEAEEELAALGSRQKTLIAFIESAHRLLGDERGRGRKRGTTYQGIESILREHARPMTVSEITTNMERRGLIRGRWAREVVRNTLSRYPQRFAHVSRGAYELRDE